MAGTSDKARFYLEQSIPELREYERKKIFKKDEIMSIARKRSYFEHILNARGSTPLDYTRYAEYEKNLDSLRRKRVKRLGVKSTSFNGQRKVFFIFDRGTRKFPADLELWLQSIDYARQQNAHKKVSQLLTSALRLNSTNAQLWTYAATFAMEEHADMTEARSYMQRGLRFCKNKKTIWLDYARLELAYIAKISARRQILGLGERSKKVEHSSVDDHNADILDVPQVTKEDIMPEDNAAEVDEDTLRALDSTPAMSGAIPIAIFDAATTQFPNDDVVSMAFFDTVAEFDQVPCRRSILEHILESMMATCMDSWRTQACHIKNPLVTLQSTSPDFPSAVGISLSRLKGSKQATNSELKVDLRMWIESLLTPDDLDESLRQVLQMMLRSVS